MIGALPRLAPRGAALAAAGFVAVGLVGVYRYVDNYWLYRGFAPPHDAPFVKTHGTAERFYLASAALAGRRQPVDVYLPPGYAAHPRRRYPVMYLLHGVPGRPGAFLATVRMGVVEDELVALHRARPAILVMPFGSTGSFTDKEWADGVGKGNGWATFVWRDVVAAVDKRYRTIRRPAGRALMGLSEGGYGAINIAMHHPHEFRVIESWSGYQTADDLGSIFGHRRALLTANTPLDTLHTAAAKLRAAHTYFWFYSGTDDRFRAQNAQFAVDLTRAHIGHRFFTVRGGHNWALWRGNAARAYLAASRRLSGT
ncbi:MAG TPA: alpha/beta hydrolase-fold protein [Gaiellaceae bacterium]|nr:alpha/beta hydrolase-fold protein [Gaiellaceae bacterium]